MPLPQPTFLFGCYQQPISNFARWKQRGCSYVVGPELGIPPITNAKNWCKAAADAGLSVVGNKFLLDAKFRPPNLIAWYLDDEPNETNHNTPIETIKAQADAFRAIDPHTPVWVNLGGDRLTGPPGPVEESKLKQIIAIADHVSFDWYVKNREFGRYPENFNGMCAKYLASLGMPTIGAMQECSWQKLNKSSPLGRAPSPSELETSIMHKICNGVTNICFFSTTQGTDWPADYDLTSQENSDMITAVTQRVQIWAQGLISNPITSQRLLTLSLGGVNLFQGKV